MAPGRVEGRRGWVEGGRLRRTEGGGGGPAAFGVGNASGAQFSREYARRLGAPPRRETQQARESLVASRGASAALAEAM